MDIYCFLKIFDGIRTRIVSMFKNSRSQNLCMDCKTYICAIWIHFIIFFLPSTGSCSAGPMFLGLIIQAIRQSATGELVHSFLCHFGLRSTQAMDTSWIRAEGAAAATAWTWAMWSGRNSQQFHQYNTATQRLIVLQWCGCLFLFTDSSVLLVSSVYMSNNTSTFISCRIWILLLRQVQDDLYYSLNKVTTLSLCRSLSLCSIYL